MATLALKSATAVTWACNVSSGSSSTPWHCWLFPKWMVKCRRGHLLALASSPNFSQLRAATMAIRIPNNVNSQGPSWSELLPCTRHRKSPFYWKRSLHIPHTWFTNIRWNAGHGDRFDCWGLQSWCYEQLSASCSEERTASFHYDCSHISDLHVGAIVLVYYSCTSISESASQPRTCAALGKNFCKMNMKMHRHALQTEKKNGSESDELIEVAQQLPNRRDFYLSNKYPYFPLCSHSELYVAWSNNRQKT